MSDDYGSGVHLDQNLDLGVGETGDLKSDSGENELQKDLAFQMILGLDQYIGQPPSGNLPSKVAGTAKTIAERDERIDFVKAGETEVSFTDDRRTIELSMVVQADNEEVDLVFDI